jgi:hypothetical protein
MPSAFHLIGLPVVREDDTLEAALDALTDVEPGESVFFSEAVAWTAEGSGIAFTRLVRAARERDVNLVATMNLGGELIEDLPGRTPDTRYHAVVIFTRHGDVQVPQAKCLPDANELAGAPGDDAAPVAPYVRSNRVRLDMVEQLIEVRFLIGADIALLADHAPADWACDVLVSLARLPLGAEDKVRKTLAEVRNVGLASTTIQINGTFVRASGEPIVVKTEEAGDHGRVIAAAKRWPKADSLSRRLYRWKSRRRDVEPAAILARLADDEDRKGRIPINRPLRAPKITLGIYPITIVL